MKNGLDEFRICDANKNNNNNNNRDVVVDETVLLGISNHYSDRLINEQKYQGAIKLTNNELNIPAHSNVKRCIQ